MNDQKFVKVSDLFRCETCYHTSPKGCVLGTFACDLGEAYRPAMSLLPTLTLDDLRAHGAWITQNSGYTKFQCSACGSKNHDICWPFCCKCGAKMDLPLVKFSAKTEKKKERENE